jgi:hypothetical protein
MEPATYKNTSGHVITLDDGSIVEPDAFVDLVPLTTEKGKTKGNAAGSAQAAIDAGQLVESPAPKKANR